MTCPTCGSELDAAGNCVQCTAPASPPALPMLSSPAGDPFAPSEKAIPANPWKEPVIIVLAIGLFTLVVWMNYLRAMLWAGVINPESSGYMMGGIFFNFLMGLLGMFVVKKIREKSAGPASRALLVAFIAVIFSFLGLAGEIASKSRGLKPDAYHKTGNLLKEAAGKLPASANVNWYDGPTRDFFHDILEMNQRYTAEVAKVDNSAIKDLYSSKSYGGEVHMKRVVTQLRAALAVDEKYTPLEPLIKKLEERVAATNASESEKQEFLKGLHGSIEKGLGPRNDLIQKEEAWMKCTIDLYEFAIAHTADYSIRDNKLYFSNKAARESFTAQQTKAIALHKEFLKAKSAFEESRKSKMNQLGVSPSDLTPAQMGKQK